MAKVAPDLSKRVSEALVLGLECFGDGDSTPFVILIAASESRLIELHSADGTIGEALLTGGRDIIRQFVNEGTCYMLVWDGYLTAVGKREEAAFAEAGEAGVARAQVFAQRYRRTETGKTVGVGKPLVVAEADHLWPQVRNAEPGTVADGGG